MLFNDAFRWNPISATAFHEYLAKSKGIVATTTSPVESRFVYASKDERNDQAMLLDYSRSLESQRNLVHPSIFINPKDLEVFRIHPVWNQEGCLTYYFKSNKLTWSTCVEHELFEEMRSVRISHLQIFFLYVDTAFDPFHLPHHLHTVLDVKAMYDIHKDYSYRHINQAYGYNVTRIIHHGIPIRNGHLECLTVESIEVNANVVMKKCATRSLNEYSTPDPLFSLYWRQLFLTVQGSGRGSHPLTSIGLIRLHSAPHLCVARNLMPPLLNLKKDSEIARIFKISECDIVEKLQNHFEFEMMVN